MQRSIQQIRFEEESHWALKPLKAGMRIPVLGGFLYFKIRDRRSLMPINAGDNAWLLMSAALVMLMTPGLAFFYGGMVRRKNALSTIMMSFAILGLVGILWVLYGYSLSFGSD